MDQKNTIVKCKAHPDCLFNHNGVCDNYVINIGEDGKCECYVETCPEGINVTEEEVIYENAQRMLEKADVTLIEPKGEVKRGQRAKVNFIQDGVDQEIVNEVCKPLTERVCDWSCRHALRDGPSFNPYIWCQLRQLNPVQGFTCTLYEKEQ